MSEKYKDEFKNDVLELMARDDIQCRDDICREEYKKANSLLNVPTQEKVLRCYNIMGQLASEFEYIPAILWMADFAESAKKDINEAATWYKRAADMGDGNGARCYADFIMSGQIMAQSPNEAFKYYSLAANKGVPEAAFVLAQFMLKQGDKEQAKELLQQAINGGYSPAAMLLEKIKNQ